LTRAAPSRDRPPLANEREPAPSIG